MSDRAEQMITDLQIMFDLVCSRGAAEEAAAFGRLTGALQQSLEHTEAMQEGMKIMANGLDDIFTKVAALNAKRQTNAKADEAKTAEALSNWIAQNFVRTVN